MSNQSASETAQVHSMAGHTRPFAGHRPRTFLWDVRADGRVATLTLNRPERKNPLTFESYAELRDLFRDLKYASDVKVIVVSGAGGNFCSGGDVHEIIGPLTRMSMPELLAFTRMTGDLIKAMRACPCRSGRGGHGRLHAAAAHDRPGKGVRVAVFRARHDR